MSLELLVRELTEAITWEQKAKEKRIFLELAVAKVLSNKDEGVDHADVGGYRVTVTSKLNRTLDYNAYLLIKDGLPEGVQCVDMKPAINIKKLRALEMLDPSIPAQFITTKPAKPAVKVELIEE